MRNSAGKGDCPLFSLRISMVSLEFSPQLARATYRKMVQNLLWATGYNVVAIPLAAGVLYQQGILLSPAAGAILMSLSTIIVAINARLLRLPSK